MNPSRDLPFEDLASCLECSCAVPHEVPGNRRLFELAASFRRFYFLKTELFLEFFVRLTVHLDIGIHEVVEH
jgi:hypothetical protein